MDLTFLIPSFCLVHGVILHILRSNLRKFDVLRRFHQKHLKVYTSFYLSLK